MNILPKKKWHVRTKENVARVRRDQKKAKEEEQRVIERARLAEQEHKVNLLRQNAERMEIPFGSSRSEVDDGNTQFISSSGHVNLFLGMEMESLKNLGVGNREYELEKKKEQEDYEKKIGILQYLGQGSNELTKEKPWYEKISVKKDNGNKSTKSKGQSSLVGMFRERVDNAHSKKKEHIKKHKDKASLHKKHRKKSKHHCSSLKALSSEDESSGLERISKKKKLEKLRQERLDREEKERKRLTNLLTPLDGDKKVIERSVTKYNSQFNPALARQNQIR